MASKVSGVLVVLAIMVGGADAVPAENLAKKIQPEKPSTDKSQVEKSTTEIPATDESQVDFVEKSTTEIPTTDESQVDKSTDADKEVVEFEADGSTESTSREELMRTERAKKEEEEPEGTALQSGAELEAGGSMKKPKKKVMRREGMQVEFGAHGNLSPQGVHGDRKHHRSRPMQLFEFAGRQKHQDKNLKLWKEHYNSKQSLCPLPDDEFDCEDGYVCVFEDADDQRVETERDGDMLKVTKENRIFFIQGGASDDQPAYYMTLLKDCNDKHILVKATALQEGDALQEEKCSQTSAVEKFKMSNGQNNSAHVTAKVETQTKEGRQCTSVAVSEDTMPVPTTQDSHDSLCLVSKTPSTSRPSIIHQDAEIVELDRQSFLLLLEGDTSFAAEKLANSSCEEPLTFDRPGTASGSSLLSMDRTLASKDLVMMIVGAVLMCAAFVLTTISGGAFAPLASIVFGWGCIMLISAANSKWGSGAAISGGGSFGKGGGPGLAALSIGANQILEATSRTIGASMDTGTGGGPKVALKGGYYNRYCADEGYTVKCNRDVIGRFEKFTLVEILDGEYHIQHSVNARFLDAYNSGYFEVVTREEQTDDSQKWVIKPVAGIGSGTYTIQHKMNMRYLDAYTTSYKDYGARTKPAEWNYSQKWIITLTDNGAHTIEQKSPYRPYRFLDAWETSRNDYEAVTRTVQDNKSQKWYITKVAFPNGCDGGWKIGDGTGGWESKAGHADSRPECIELVKQKCPTANGATFDAGGAGNCYCEFSVSGKNGNKKWHTCKFEALSYSSECDTPSAKKACMDGGSILCQEDWGWGEQLCAIGYIKKQLSGRRRLRWQCCPSEAWEKQVALRGGNNNKFCQDTGNTIKCDQNSVGSQEKFTLYDAGNGKTAIKGGFNKQFCSNRAGFNDIRCNQNEANDAEKFVMSAIDSK